MHDLWERGRGNHPAGLADKVAALARSIPGAGASLDNLTSDPAALAGFLSLRCIACVDGLPAAAVAAPVAGLAPVTGGSDSE